MKDGEKRINEAVDAIMEEISNAGVINPVYDESSRIITDEEIYQIDLLPEDLDNFEFKEDVAYLHGKYYYLLVGEASPNQDNLRPGIYRNADEKGKFFVVEPMTDEEKKEYNALDNMASLLPKSIIDSANTKEDLLIAVPERLKIFKPEITENDNILKRVTKQTLIAKNVDLDAYKERFYNKNELFNFKQVLRGDAPMSMKIFTRGMEALNVEFLLVVKEKENSDLVIGDKLTEPISSSSEETYAI